MKRVIWFALGVTVTALAVWKAKQLYHKATPQGMQESLMRSSERARGGLADFLSDVRTHAESRESEIKEALGLMEQDAEARAEEARRAAPGTQI